MITTETLWRDLAAIRERAPLIHNITNYVVMNSTANGLLAVGASPIMAHAVEELEDLLGIASSLVLNIGTLSPAWIAAMERAATIAKQRSLPVVVDPVGAGASGLRTRTAALLIEAAGPAVVRGNASEIRALAWREEGTKGVDSAHTAESAVEAARAIASRQGCVVSVSGEVDHIVSADAVIRVRNGHPLLPRITGSGCLASALTGAFLAVNPSALEAAAHAMVTLGIAGEIAGAKSAGPGSFEAHLLDALHNLSEADLGGMRVDAA